MDNFDLGCTHTISFSSERYSNFGFIVLVALEIRARFVNRLQHQMQVLVLAPRKGKPSKHMFLDKFHLIKRVTTYSDN